MIARCSEVQSLIFRRAVDMRIGITRRIFDGGPPLGSGVLNFKKFQDLEFQDLEILKLLPERVPGAGADRTIFFGRASVSPRAGTNRSVEILNFQDFLEFS